LHNIGITHNDLKLENILSNRKGTLIKIVDFGRAGFNQGSFKRN
jgi:serine/threonine protein kinase